jgi:sigma54-dependent transcription regulator
MNTAQPTLSERIEIIESAYEFMLAYAAQGRDTDEGLTSGLAIRDVLSNLSNALDGLSNSIVDDKQESVVQDFGETLAADAINARRAVELVISRSQVSSQLIDNLNASIHLRSVLTDLFLIDEAFKS